MPAYLQGDGAVTLATSARFKRAIDAIQNDRPHAVPATIDYLTTLAEQLEGFRIEPDAAIRVVLANAASRVGTVSDQALEDSREIGVIRRAWSSLAEDQLVLP
jgi:hypothetical protein